MTIGDLGPFTIGMGIGATITALWFAGLFARFIAECGNRNCPHHHPQTKGPQTKDRQH